MSSFPHDHDWEVADVLFWNKTTGRMEALLVCQGCNKFKEEYFRRVTYVIPEFRAGLRAGWKTDRGRVFILYGQPDQVTSYRHEVDSRPYEVWQYEQLQGGVLFVFMDRTGFDDYYLVHATARNEYYNPQWEAQLLPGR